MGLTIFLLGALYVAFVAILIAIGLGTTLVLGIAVIILFVQYFFSDKIALFGMHGHIVTEAEAPDLHQVVSRLCALANMPKPKVAIANTDIPNAFATGRNPKNSVVCVTTGLLRRLTNQEVEAVLSHELSHVAHRDVAVMTVASFLGIVAGLLTRLLYFSAIFGGGFGGGYGGGGGRGGGNSNNSNSSFFAVELAVMVVSIVVYAISFLLIRALSRYRELSADRSGAILIGRPALLKSALIKITGEMGRIPTKDIRSAAAFNAFYFTPAMTQGNSFSLSSLFATHPSLEKRIEQLDALDRELGTAE
jgi:heat shock protein HtpX